MSRWNNRGGPPALEHTMKTLIIGCLGPAGSGKTTIAKYMAERHGAKRYSFADPLKRVAMATLNLTWEQVYGTQEQKETIDPRYGFSPRWFLQQLGTRGCRGVFGDSFWSAQTIKLIKDDNPPIAIIDDVRFINEAQEIRAADGLIWRIECQDRDSSADSTHPSETEWMRAAYDRTVRDSVSEGLEALYAQIDAIMNAYNDVLIDRARWH